MARNYGKRIAARDKSSFVGSSQNIEVNFALFLTKTVKNTCCFFEHAKLFLFWNNITFFYEFSILLYEWYC